MPEHVSTEELRLLFLCKLSVARQREVEQHLLVCDECALSAVYAEGSVAALFGTPASN